MGLRPDTRTTDPTWRRLARRGVQASPPRARPFVKAGGAYLRAQAHSRLLQSECSNNQVNAMLVADPGRRPRACAGERKFHRPPLRGGRLKCHDRGDLMAKRRVLCPLMAATPAHACTPDGSSRCPTTG